MSKAKCCICQKPFAPNQVIVRILVEAVSRHAEDGDDSDYWSQVHEWTPLHQVHLTCAARMQNKGEPFEYGRELSELPLDEMVDELIAPEPVPTPLRLVQGGTG